MEREALSRLDWQPILRLGAQIVESYPSAVTLRQLHYRLVADPAVAYANTDANYKRLSELTAKARRRGEFPTLADLTRTIQVSLSYQTIDEALSDLAADYRRDRTDGQRLVPMIIAEKATLISQLHDWFGGPLGVPIVALRGYSSESYEREIRSYLEPRLARGRDYSALYLGDFDPSGQDIERNAQRYLGDLFETWRRVAITPAVIEAHELLENPGKTTDSRAESFAARHGRLVQVEVEALDPTDLRSLVQAAIYANWDTSAFAAVLRREQEERELLQQLATGEQW